MTVQVRHMTVEGVSFTRTADVAAVLLGLGFGSAARGGIQSASRHRPRLQPMIREGENWRHLPDVHRTFTQLASEFLTLRPAAVKQKATE